MPWPYKEEIGEGIQLTNSLRKVFNENTKFKDLTSQCRCTGCLKSISFVTLNSGIEEVLWTPCMLSVK